MVVSKGFVYHKKHYAGKECKSQTYENSDLQKRDNVTLHMLKWHMSNLIIKWLIVTAMLTDCSLHSTVQYLTKHGNWMSARSNSLEFSHHFHPPTDLRECTFLCLTPCKCMDFTEAFGVLGGFAFPCSQLFNQQHHLLVQQDPPAARVHIQGLICADKLPHNHGEIPLFW